MRIQSLFTKKPIIGMIHLLPLPGSPNYKGDMDAIPARALAEAKILQRGSLDGVIIENFNDIPFSNEDISREQLALMAVIISQVQRELSIPVGVNVHFNDWKSEIALAFACKAQFVRIEVFVDTVVTASGIIQPCCAEVMRYRKSLLADGLVEIWADIHPKYSYNFLPVSLQDSAKMAKNNMADTIIVTGETTGKATPLEDIRKVKEVVDLPIFAGSGVSLENVVQTLAIADGAIVGSAFKLDGDVHNEVSEERVTEFMKAVSESRK
jgi:membrane complex biogenesis BtpA family protein